MDRSAHLGGNLIQNCENLFLFVRLYFGVDEDSYRETSIGRVFFVL